MKRIFLFFCAGILATTASAQSTCLTRVDAHQQATTKERISYCLSPDTVQGTANNSGVIFSGVSLRQVPVSYVEEQKPTATNGYFKEDQVTVSKNFVSTQRFPQLTESRMSVQEQLAQLKQQAQPTLSPVQTACPDGTCVTQTAPVAGQTNAQQFRRVTETISGLRARQKKPGRRLLQQVQPVQESAADTVLLPSDDVATPYAPSNADVSTTGGYAPVEEDAYAPYTQPSADSTSYMPADSATSYAPADGE